MPTEVRAKMLSKGMRVILNDAEHEIQYTVKGAREITIISTIEFSGWTKYVQTPLDNDDRVLVLYPPNPAQF